MDERRQEHSYLGAEHGNLTRPAACLDVRTTELTMSKAKTERFPFGQSVLVRQPSATSPRRCFILGAYPSALHVEWIPPKPWKRVQAIAVDNEPEPFWTGHDQEKRVAVWRKAVGWKDTWGILRLPGGLNGPSGQWVEERVLVPLRAGRAEAWITDCLDTYRCSDGVKKRIGDTYNPFATANGLQEACLADHPNEAAIVAEAVEKHLDRLAREIEACRPELVVTLGNAALRVLRKSLNAGELPAKLSADEGVYGKPYTLSVAGRVLEVFPLAHPAAPQVYQNAHAMWMRNPGR